MNFKKEQVKLLAQNKPFIVLQNVKDKYPNVSSQSVILSQIKRMYLSDPNHRLPAYEPHMKKLLKEHPEVKDFESKPPYQQDKIQKKIQNGKSVYTDELDKIIVKIPLFNKDIDKYIKLQPNDAKTLRRTQTQSLNNKHHNIKIINGQELMNTFLPMLNSDKTSERICAVLLATGRRQNEIVKGNITESKKGPYFAIFKGQSKTGLDIERDSYCIPLLAPFHLVKDSWEKSRSYFEDKAFKIKIRNVSRWLKKQDTNVDKLHEFRSIYALICYELFPTGRLSQMAYISSVLGETSINIASHYNSIKVEHIKKIWVPEGHNFVMKGGDPHTDMIAPVIEEFILKQIPLNNKKKLTKTLIGRLGEKSQSVVNRFYKINEPEIIKYNKLFFP
jgi:hypothetical protein